MSNTLITVLGWEDRFRLGVEINFKKEIYNQLIIVIFKDYFNMKGMKESLIYLEKLAKQKGVDLKRIELVYNKSVENWKTLDRFFSNNQNLSNVTLNITTIPRETIWTFLFFLKKNNQNIDYVYFKPKEYTKGWLTKNHKNPRLLFKHSGVFELNKQLALFIITGFDKLRLRQLIEFYEPDKIVLFCQNGEQYGNHLRNNGFSNSINISIEQVEIDSYSVTDATKTIKEKIKSNSDFNIILSSQGPKISSLSTYLCYLEYKDQIALSYVPAREFNGDYSTGIEENYVSGNISLT